MPILADASANVSGAVIMPILFVLYICCPYGSVYNGMANFFRGDGLSKVNLCKFVTKWAKVFKFIFSLTYSLLPPPVCIDKMWN